MGGKRSLLLSGDLSYMRGLSAASPLERRPKNLSVLGGCGLPGLGAQPQPFDHRSFDAWGVLAVVLCPPIARTLSNTGFETAIKNSAAAMPVSAPPMPVQIASTSFQNLSRPVLLVLAVGCGRCAAMLASMTLTNVAMARSVLSN